MASKVPIFPLNTVLFPGLKLPLHIFEDRYRSLVDHLLAETDESKRRFGIVAIRDGYEVGEKSVRAAHRVGCEALLVNAESYPDGRFDIEIVGQRRFRLDAMDASHDLVSAEVTYLDESEGSGAEDEATRAHAVFESYRSALSKQRGGAVLKGQLPDDPATLAYALAATSLITLRDQQDLLEAPDVATRLRRISALLRNEISAMRAIPSLPAFEVSRAAWSPN